MFSKTAKKIVSFFGIFPKNMLCRIIKSNKVLCRKNKQWEQGDF